MEKTDLAEVESFLVEHEDKQLNALDDDHQQVLQNKAENYLDYIENEMGKPHNVSFMGKMLRVRRELKKMLEALTI